MNKRALVVIVVGAMGLLVAALAPTGPATAQPRPTLTLSPASGPCDGPVQVQGTGFLDQRSLRLYLLRPGTADISMGLLNSGFVLRDGTFNQAAALYNGGCEAAALDSQAGQATGKLSIVASFTLELRDVKPGEPIPNIVAVAQYAYTTTVGQPQPTLTLSPSGGPCDATVRITGQDFPPNTAIVISMGTPKSDGTLGGLTTLVTDPSGAFITKVNLGPLGCRAAMLDDYYSGVLSIGADFEDPTVNGENILTRTSYTYTTTTLSPAPQVLPSTGTGPEARSALALCLPLAGTLAGIGLLLVAASLHRGRRLRS